MSKKALLAAAAAVAVMLAPDLAAAQQQPPAGYGPPAASQSSDATQPPAPDLAAPNTTPADGAYPTDPSAAAASQPATAATAGPTSPRTAGSTYLRTTASPDNGSAPPSAYGGTLSAATADPQEGGDYYQGSDYDSPQDDRFAFKPYFFVLGGYGFDGDLDAEDVDDIGDFFDNLNDANEESQDLQGGWQVSGGVGVDNAFLPGLRLELEGLFTNNDLDEFNSLEVKTLGGLGNALYEFKLGQVAPYLGAGVGYGRTSLNFDPDDDLDSGEDANRILRDSGLIWQLKAGVAIPVQDTLVVDVGYRYFNGARVENTFTNAAGQIITGELDPEVHAITAGVRFTPAY